MKSDTTKEALINQRFPKSLLTKCFILAIFIGGITSCSNRSVYEGMRIANRNDCLLEPPHLQEACMDKTRMSYEEYESKRQEVISE